MSCGNVTVTSRSVLESAWYLDWGWLKWYFLIMVLIFILCIVIDIEYRDWKQRKKNS